MPEQADVPELDEPILIAAFEGWNDAADAATAAVEHLEEAWNARIVWEIDPDDYYDFQVNRPTVSLAEGRSRRITWPTTRVSVGHAAGRDVVLVRGLEPNMRWRAFCTELVDFARQVGVTTAVTLGALLSDSPHTRPVPVSGAAADAALAERLGLTQSRYEGPTGISGVFQHLMVEAGIDSVSFWAAVPHYVATPPCPKATLALLTRVEDLLDVAVPLGDLADEARAWERGVDELAREDAEIGEYVTALEQRSPAEELPDASGDAIAREFERYLRRRSGDDI